MEINSESLKRYRESKGLSQAEFADFLGISTRSLQDYEGGKNIPKSKKELLSLKLSADFAGESAGTYEKTPPEEVRFQDIVAKKVLQEIGPLLNGNTDKILKAVMNLHIELNQIKNAQARTQETVEAIEQSLE